MPDMTKLQELVAKWRKNGESTRHRKTGLTHFLSATQEQMVRIHNHWNRIASLFTGVNSDPELWKTIQDLAEILFRTPIAIDPSQPTPLGCAMLVCAKDLESALNAEPPGSVAGDEYDAAARDWYRMHEMDKESGVRLAAHFRAACGSREVLEHAYLRLRGRFDELGIHSKNDWDDVRTEMFAGLSARAKQGKETRT